MMVNSRVVSAEEVIAAEGKGLRNQLLSRLIHGAMITFSATPMGLL